jgi:hypothetical protein
MAAPPVGIDLLVFIREDRLKSSTMQVQFDDIAGGEPLLRQVREEEFVDHSCACHPNGALLLSGRMRGHNHAAGDAIGSHRDLRAIIEAARCPAFGSLLCLIRWEVQPRLNQRMIEQVIVFPAGDKREASHIGEHSPVPILAVEARASCVLVEVGGL